MTKISIDLIICTYNNAPLLQKALTAISQQKVSPEIDWQVLVVNNNCTDETPEVVENYAQTFPVPLKIILETKQGLHHARLCGIKNTNGNWIALVDDDCLIAKDFVEKLAKFASEHPDCGAFGAKITLDWEIEPPIYAVNRKWAFAGRNHGDQPKRRDWIAGTGMILKRKAIEESGWLEKQFLEDRVGNRLVSGGDVEMGLRIGQISEVWYNPACQLRHIIPARRLTRQYVRKIVFGLGGSRHNVAALEWKGSYLAWFFYSLIYSIGLTIYAIFDAISGFVSSPAGSDIPSAFTPVLGWWAAMWTMFRMDKKERKELLGGAVSKKGSGSNKREKLYSHMVKLKCIHCQSENIVRNGKTSNGKQRYLCNDCGKMSRDNPQPNGYLPEEREQILAAYQERSSLRGLTRTFGVARNTVSGWLKKKKH